MSSNSESNEPTNLPERQLVFLGAMYRDIVLEIFSYLTQQDCLTCMAVCRDWYATVPQHAQNAWKEIHLDWRDASVDHQRRQQCLGSHVERVTITSMKEEEDLSSIVLVQRLLDWKCTRIQSLEFNQADIPDQMKFFNLLKQLASRLTHLKLDIHKSSTAILAVLYACPELTCFDYCQNSAVTWQWSKYMTPKTDQKLDALSLGVPANFCTKITYLRLDTFIKREDVKHILKQCPQLQCYIGPNSVNLRNLCEAYISIDSIFSLCPKINSLAVMSNDATLPKSAGDFISKLPGLRYFDIPWVFETDEVAAWLTKSQNTLEYLSFPQKYYSEDWSPTLRSLRMPNLHFLSYWHAEISISSIVPFLNQCPNLQQAALLCPCPFDLKLVRSLYTMQSLHSLRIKKAEFTDGAAFATFLELFPALETLFIDKAFLPRELPKHFQSPEKLKSLTIATVIWTPLENQELDKYEATAHFLRELTKHTKLETVHFCNMPDIKLVVYQELAKIPTLKDLVIPLGYLNNDTLFRHLYESNVAYEFEFSRLIHMLRMTSIERLELLDCYNLSAAMLDALAELPLKEFSTSMFLGYERYTNVESQNLIQLLRKSQSLVDIAFNSVQGFDYEQLNELIWNQDFANNMIQTRVGYWRAYSYDSYMRYPTYHIIWIDV